MRWSPVAMILLAACDAGSPGPAGPTSGPHAAAGASVFSREAFAPRSPDAGGADLPVPASADPEALAEILAAAPRPSARASTAPDGGTALGSETGTRADAGPPVEAPRAEGKPASRVRPGPPQMEPDLSGPAIELMARAQIYWPLTQRCRGPDGEILPPETVHLQFRVDADGYLIPASIVATAAAPRFAPAARCMSRELSRTMFRAPPGARGGGHKLQADVPSVD